MNTAAELHDRARHLSRVARDLQTAAALPESSLAAPATMTSLEEALRAISAGWYQLAADAASSVAGLSRERQVHLTATLHDLAAAFAGCARECRKARSTAEPMIGVHTSVARPGRDPDQPSRPAPASAPSGLASRDHR
jgi:hypothetical protein